MTQAGPSLKFSQNALTATPAPALDWSREGTPASSGFNDIYFSVDGGLEETQTVFLGGCGLPARIEDMARAPGPAMLCIGELGFGSGLNFLSALDLWRRAGPAQDRKKRLHFVSIEAMPWTKHDLRRGLSAFPQLASLAEELIANWPGQVKGVHRLHFGNVCLTLYHMDALAALAVMDARIDAWFLDGFSPSKNPEMWSADICQALAGHSSPGAALATFSVAGPVRRALEAAGFETFKKTGFGRKRHRLEAVFTGGARPINRSKSPQKHIIIGGGIAGASIARALQRRGINPVLIDPDSKPHLGRAASGNPAAMVMPRLDLQDRPESRFFLSAYLYALAQYGETQGVLQRGALQLAQTAKEAERFAKLAAQAALPDEHMRLAVNAGGSAGTGLDFGGALLINPKTVIESWTQDCVRICANAASIEAGESYAAVLDNGERLSADTIYVCAGADVLEIGGINGMSPVRFTRGQISYGPSGGHAPDRPLVYGGYAAPIGGGDLLLGATHAHVGPGSRAAISDEDMQANRRSFEILRGCRLPDQGWASRASVRVTTKDTLPISQDLGGGVYVLSGLGARGFMMAPLLAEAQVCRALGEPAPLCQNTKMRFGEREVSKLQSASGSLKPPS